MGYLEEQIKKYNLNNNTDITVEQAKTLLDEDANATGHIFQSQPREDNITIHTEDPYKSYEPVAKEGPLTPEQQQMIDSYFTTTEDETPIEEKSTTPYDDIIDREEYTYDGNVPTLDNLIPDADKDVSIWDSIKVGAEVGSSAGQFLSNRELYGSHTYNTTHTKDPNFTFNSPDVVALINATDTRDLLGVEDALSYEHMKLIIERNKYNTQLGNEYNEAGSSKYLGLVTGMAVDPLNAVPIAGGMKLLSSTASLSKKLGGYASIGGAFGASDEYLRGQLQSTESSIGSGLFYGGLFGIGLGGVTHLLSRGVSMKGATDSVLNPNVSSEAAKFNFMGTPTEKLLNSNSKAFQQLGKLLNRGPNNKDNEVINVTSNDVKYQVMNLGAQSEAEFKQAYKLALEKGYTGTYDEYLEDGLGEIIGATHYPFIENVNEDFSNLHYAPEETGVYKTTDVLNTDTAQTNVGGSRVKYVDLPEHFTPLATAFVNNNKRLSTYLDEVLPEKVAGFDVEAGAKLDELTRKINSQYEEISNLKTKGADTHTIDVAEYDLIQLQKKFDVLTRDLQKFNDTTKLKASLTQGASYLTKYYTINTKAVSSMSKKKFVDTMVSATTRLTGATTAIQADIIKVYEKAYNEILAKYTRGDTEDFIVNKLITYDEVPLFSELVSKLNPLDVKGIMYSDAGIASHYFHTELAGNTGLASKGLPLNDDMYRSMLEKVSKEALAEGIDAEEVRKLSTQALDLYRQVRGDYMPMPSAGEYGQAVKAFNNLTYSAVGGGFGVLSALDIAVGVTANGFKETFKSIGKGLNGVITQVRGKDLKVIQEALQLGAGGEMMMGMLKSRFFELDGTATDRTINKLNTEHSTMTELLVSKTDFLADKVSTYSGLRHVSSWLQYTAMYASMGKFISMAKKTKLSNKELNYLKDKGLTHSDLQAIPLDKIKYNESGEPIMYNLVDWNNSDLVQKITVASNRAVNNAVIKADASELPNWFNHLSSSPTGSMITAFMKYVVASHSAIMKRGYYGDKSQFFQGIATASVILMTAKLLKEEALVAGGVLDDKDRKYRLFDSLGNWDEEGLQKLAIDTITFLPQLGAVSVLGETGLTVLGINKEGERAYSTEQMRALGNINNVLKLGKTLGGEITGDTDAVDRLYNYKSLVPFNNLYYIDSIYMNSVKDAVE